MKKLSAFTLIELVMVIVVFGIVAGIGAEILVKVYENYLRTRAINRLQSQTEITLEQIAKRLQYRIKDSVRASNDAGANWVSLPNATVGYTIIEWLGISNESFLGEHNGASVVPGWSGFLDMDDTVNTNLAARTLSTPGSTLSYARDIILALSDNNVNMDNEGGKLPALIFKGSKPLYNVNLYYNQGVNNYTTRISRNTDSTFHIPANDNLIDFDNDGFGDLFEQYYLSHTAYALVLSANAANDGFDLTLFYNYQPWEGETYAANGTSVPLAEDVSTFRIRQEGDVIRIKLCIHDNNQNSNFDFSACKEKVIY